MRENSVGLVDRIVTFIGRGANAALPEEKVIIRCEIEEDGDVQERVSAIL